MKAALFAAVAIVSLGASGCAGPRIDARMDGCITLIPRRFGFAVYKLGQRVGTGLSAIEVATRDDPAAHALATRSSGGSIAWSAMAGTGVGFILLGGGAILVDGLQNFSSKWESGLGGAAIALGIAQIILGAVEMRKNRPDQGDPLDAVRLYNSHCTFDQRQE